MPIGTRRQLVEREFGPAVEMHANWTGRGTFCDGIAQRMGVESMNNHLPAIMIELRKRPFRDRFVESLD